MGLLPPNQCGSCPQSMGLLPPKRGLPALKPMSSPKGQLLCQPTPHGPVLGIPEGHVAMPGRPPVQCSASPKDQLLCQPPIPMVQCSASPKDLLPCQAAPHGPVLGIPEGPVAVPVPTPLVPCSASPKDLLLHRPLVTARGPELWLFGRVWGEPVVCTDPQVGLCSLRITVCLMSLLRLACCPSSWPATSLVSTLIVGFSVPFMVSVMH